MIGETRSAKIALKVQLDKKSPPASPLQEEERPDRQQPLPVRRRAKDHSDVFVNRLHTNLEKAQSQQAQVGGLAACGRPARMERMGPAAQASAPHVQAEKQRLLGF